jgi:histidyl-tRNA synthetase
MDRTRKLALLYDESDPMVDVMEKSDQLRQEGFVVSVFKTKKKLGKQIAQLEAAGFTHLWVFGRDEAIGTLGEIHDN